MISYAYMGKAVGFDVIEERQKKYELLLVNNNLMPYDMQLLYSTGFGVKLPNTLIPIDEETKSIFIKNLEFNRSKVHEQFKHDLANKI